MLTNVMNVTESMWDTQSEQSIVQCMGNDSIMEQHFTCGECGHETDNEVAHELHMILHELHEMNLIIGEIQ